MSCFRYQDGGMIIESGPDIFQVRKRRLKVSNGMMLVDRKTMWREVRSEGLVEFGQEFGRPSIIKIRLFLHILQGQQSLRYQRMKRRG